MAGSYSDDLRKRVIGAVEAGASCREAAARFEVSASSAIRWMARWRRTGSSGALKRGGDQRSHRIEAHADVILKAVEQTPDLSLAELRKLVRDKTGASFGIGTIWRFLKRHRVSLKKNRARSRTRAA